MRIPSGVTDQYIYFVAVDATDFTSRETGLSSFTVYRSRDGGAAAAMTTPTINETDTTNMPGVYELLLDEDMTIASGNDSEEMCFHITHAGMAPVTRTIELYRPKITAGNTLGVAADGDVSGNVDGNVVGSVASVTGAVGSVTGNVGGNVTGSVGSLGATAKTDVNAEVDTALADIGLDHLISSALPTNWATDVASGSVFDNIADDGVAAFDRTTDSLQAIADSGGGGPTAAQIADAVWDEAQADHVAAGSFGVTATEIADILADTNELQTDDVPGLIAALNDPTAATIADAVWDESTVGHTTAGTFGEQVKTDIDAVLADTNELQTDWADAGRLDAILDARASQTSVDTVDSNVDAILADTGGLRVKKNTALANFTFVMRNSAGDPATGLTVSGFRSIDGAAFAATATATATEISNGAYKLNLAAADLNGDTILLRFTATGADDLFIGIVTQAV